MAALNSAASWTTTSAARDRPAKQSTTRQRRSGKCSMMCGVPDGRDEIRLPFWERGPPARIKTAGEPPALPSISLPILHLRRAPAAALQAAEICHDIADLARLENAEHRR